MMIAAAAIGLSSCKVETQSTSEVSVSVNTDKGSKEYSFKAENNNGVVTTEKAVTESTTETVKDEDTESPVVEAAAYVDEYVESVWSQEGCGHHTTYDDDEIYVQIWYEGLSTTDDIDEQAFREDVIPEWLDDVAVWREELDGRGLSNVELCLQYVTDKQDEEIVYFTIEGGEVIYFVLDEQ